ncbi:hypothetical protein Y032_0097g3038 [Ancylostoma ceylanicum]|uniref:Small ribosomal subunit protein uS10 domain-containing protein n=1 Tax=Ancylostoma ceylanicum TaxID=53326 RepID=A0A016TJT4_9BILA|nr:hypothetical protein Y032_0097g3038 [Ancylostoma ceylanicum]
MSRNFHFNHKNFKYWGVYHLEGKRGMVLFCDWFVQTLLPPITLDSYDTLNVRIQGYDFTHIEKFQGYVDRMARRFNFKVLESYAVAAQTQRVVTYKPNSTIVDNEVNLALYDRVLRLGNVPAPHLQLFISLIQTHLPVGVTVTFKEHEKADEDYRYIPDILLKQKQEELKALDDPVVRRNLGWE